MKRKTVLLIAAAVIFCLCLSGCGRYVSSYRASAFVHSNTSDHAMMSFWQFEGRMVFRLKTGSDGSPVMTYTGSLQTGAAEVYYDSGDGKTPLFSIKAGENVGSSADLPKNKTVYIIIETSEKCEEGSFGFSLAE